MSRKGTNKGQPAQGSEMRGKEPQPKQQMNERGNGNESMGGGGGNGENRGANQIFSSDEIAERAYQIFEREGRMDGRDMDHWLQAEQELRREREQRSGGLSAENAPRSARQHQRAQ